MQTRRDRHGRAMRTSAQSRKAWEEDESSNLEVLNFERKEERQGAIWILATFFSGRTEERLHVRQNVRAFEQRARKSDENVVTPGLSTLV